MLTTSPTKFLAPLTRLPPAVSNARTSAAGFVARKFVGASVSASRLTAICAFCAVSGSIGADATTSLANLLADR